MKLYNTLSRTKEEFRPINKELVKIYTCGPTVYSKAHIGNMRAYIFMDTLRRALIYKGYKLKHVMNITDVGHLTSDADIGEDKMELAAKKRNLSPYEIATEITNIFMQDIDKLNISKPEIIAKATDHIKEMEEYVKIIVKNGFGYETSKGIYFDTSKLPTYGELSKIDLKKQMAGARIQIDEEKKNPLDFALWIKAPKEHIMKWDSKWGMCYPGWHIECVAMSHKYLGEKFDIHTGGVDHIQIHHENEIAQSRGAYSKNPANYWLHNEFLLISGGKMSKSLGNLYTIADLEQKGYEPLVYKLFSFTAHYRNKLNFTFEAMEGAKISITRLRENYMEHLNGTENIDETILKEFEDRFTEALNDDLNMPQVVAVVFELARYKIKSKDISRLLLKFDKVLAIDINKLEKEKNTTTEDIGLTDEILEILAKRQEARANKDYLESDRLRDLLLEKNIKVIDTKEGQKTEVI